MKEQPEPAAGLVRSPSSGCDSLVQPGITCFSCRKALDPRERAERRESKSRGVMIPAEPRSADTATHRRVQDDGRRWR